MNRKVNVPFSKNDIQYFRLAVKLASIRCKLFNARLIAKWWLKEMSAYIKAFAINIHEVNVTIMLKTCYTRLRFVDFCCRANGLSSRKKKRFFNFIFHVFIMRKFVESRGKQLSTINENCCFCDSLTLNSFQHLL